MSDFEIEAKLSLDPAGRDRPDMASRFITHGLGTPAAGTYTEVAFTASSGWFAMAEDVRREIVRKVADQLYGSRWAFIYGPEQYRDAIARWDLRLREKVIVSRIEVCS
jgi:hypothetical protein